MPTLEEIKTALEGVRDETTAGANTATVVGSPLVDLADQTIAGRDNQNWLLGSDIVSAPIIAYGSANIEVNSSGTLQHYVLGGTQPITSWEVTTGSLPTEFSLDTSTGEITYVTTGATSSGSFGITATNPAGASNEVTLDWEITQANGISQFTNSESKYAFMRITTSNSIDTQLLIKSTFFGRTTSTSNGTIIEDPAYPIYVADNGNGTWNYLILPTGYSYFNLFVNSTTNPANLADSYVSDLTTSLTYDLVSPVADVVLVDGVNYPADQSDIHYGTSQNYIDFGADASLNGFLGADVAWSYGFRTKEIIPRDGLGRLMFARNGRNYHAFYLGHNDTYTSQVVGNGASRAYDSEDTAFGANIPIDSYIRVVYDGSYTVSLYVNGTLHWNYSAGFYWDNSISTDSLEIFFGRGEESNTYQSSTGYYHGHWQGLIDRLWIANGAQTSTDDDGTTFPTGTTHSWLLDETTGSTFTANTGGVTGTGASV